MTTSKRLATRKEGWVGQSQYEVMVMMLMMLMIVMMAKKGGAHRASRYTAPLCNPWEESCTH